jgi:hypothetical protein
MHMKEKRLLFYSYEQQQNMVTINDSGKYASFGTAVSNFANISSQCTSKSRVFIVQAYQTSQCVVPRGDIFVGKWRSSFAGNSDGKTNVQSACALNTQ